MKIDKACARHKRPRTLLKNINKVTPKRRKRQLAQFDCVTLKDGREGCIVEDYGDGHYVVELFDPPGVVTMSYDDIERAYDMTPEQQRIIDAGMAPPAGTFPQGLSRDELSEWISSTFIFDSFVRSLIEGGHDPATAEAEAKRLLASPGFPGFNSIT